MVSKVFCYRFMFFVRGFCYRFFVTGCSKTVCYYYCYFQYCYSTLTPMASQKLPPLRGTQGWPSARRVRGPPATLLLLQQMLWKGRPPWWTRDHTDVAHSLPRWFTPGNRWRHLQLIPTLLRLPRQERKQCTKQCRRQRHWSWTSTLDGSRKPRGFSTSWRQCSWKTPLT